MASLKTVEEGGVAMTTNPIISSPTAASSANVPLREAQQPRGSVTKNVLLAVLLVTNIAAIACAVYFGIKYSDDSSSSASSGSQALFSAGHTTVQPSAQFASASRSSPHFQRSHMFYTGTERENKTLAGGRNRILDTETGEAVYDVHTEIITDSHFGEFAGANGGVGDRALRLRIVEIATGVEVILIPHSLSLAHSKNNNVTLIPNLYFFSYLEPGRTPVATHVSTLVSGRVVMFGDIGTAEWRSFMPKFFAAYENGWTADNNSSNTARRRLGFGSWAAGKIGGYIGGHFGGDAGADIGADAAKSMYGGESVGGSIGGAVGGHFGQEAGEAVGEDVGAAAGGALGTAIGGPVGGVIGEEVGGWAGRELGGDIGQHVGEDLGSRFGNGIENDVKSWM